MAATTHALVRVQAREVSAGSHGNLVGGGLSAHRMLGEQWEWAWGVPGLFRALASPGAAAVAPASPVPERAHADVLGYWFPLPYLLGYRLGWADIGLGLRRWRDLGMPVDDPTLALVAALWDADGLLDNAVAQFASNALTHQPPGSWDWRGEPVLDTETRAWRDAFDRRWPEEHVFDIYQPDAGDGLHLAGHLAQSPSGSATLTVRSSADRTAILECLSASGWYADLAALGDALPGLDSASWKVDVYVRSIGWMGTFRKSRETGYWFSGRHRVHALGH
ncbi:hypothetical protein [Demequina soli]|uniref:hypothetical protein n=1 Tax=Demequina soli TaxID=1638987 RepID=UPI0007850927|nr:hypothetical protein [Demequina soli]